MEFHIKPYNEDGTAMYVHTKDRKYVIRDEFQKQAQEPDFKSRLNYWVSEEKYFETAITGVFITKREVKLKLGKQLICDPISIEIKYS